MALISRFFPGLHMPITLNNLDLQDSKKETQEKAKSTKLQILNQ
jgi:hypothetical protein